MTGTLFVVATPIGNLEDITLRALRVLREAHVIAAEDTRRTARLLTHFGIDTPSVSFHEHNWRLRLPQLLRRLDAGDRVALVTDAGTPSISDPGLELVQACVARSITIDPIPGASAPLTAAIASGFPLSPWTILAFVPARPKDRTEWIERLAAIPHTVSFFEAPHRIRATLEASAQVLANRPIVVARELTKAHQEFLRGTAGSVCQQLGEPRGEFTVVVGPVLPAEAPETTADAVLAAEFWQLANNEGLERREAIRRVAAKYARSSRDVYSAVEKSKVIG